MTLGKVYKNQYIASKASTPLHPGCWLTEYFYFNLSADDNFYFFIFFVSLSTHSLHGVVVFMSRRQWFLLCTASLSRELPFFCSHTIFPSMEVKTCRQIVEMYTISQLLGRLTMRMHTTYRVLSLACTHYGFSRCSHGWMPFSTPTPPIYPDLWHGWGPSSHSI